MACLWNGGWDFFVPAGVVIGSIGLFMLLFPFADAFDWQRR
jgi:hypothetical protein